MTERETRYHGDEIAVIGLAGRFPGADHIEQFWQNLRDGVESIRFFSDEELLAEGIPSETLAQRNYVKARGALDHIDRFDAAFFDMSASEAEITDPQHRLFLECAWTALEHAGYAPGTYGGRIGLYASVSMNTYGFLIFANPALIESVGSFQAILGNDKDHLSTRVAYKLNLTGPSATVQTACSSSLLSVHLACQSLLNGESEIMLAGGVSAPVPQKTGYWYQEGGIASPDGHCRAFDARAEGATGGSGMAVVVLKRLEDAVKDRDAIHAVIKGSASNNDGSAKLGYTAPSIQGQAEVIAEALNMARVAPETISYVETHGTGTPLGDPIEVAALTQAFRAGTDRRDFCAIGSVKANIGHLDVASGVTGLIKTVLALKHRQIPPSLHFEQPNPQIDFASSPFYVNASLADWPRTAGPRRAGVSSFGLGGTNVHVIVEEAPELAPPSEGRPYQLLLLSARTASALETATTDLAAYLQDHAEIDLADVAHTLQAGRSGFEHRRMLVCRNTDDALAALAPLDPKRVLTAQQSKRQRSVAFLFPGIGDHYPGMGRGLYQHEPEFRAVVDRCCALLQPLVGRDLREIIFSEPQPVDNDQAQPAKLDLRAMLGRDRTNHGTVGLLHQTELAQPAVFVIEYALAQLWMSWGIQPQALIGYSLGEYVAACLAGVLSLEDALQLVARRAQLIQALPTGAMTAVSLSESAVQPFLGDGVCLAAVNSPGTCVLAGPAARLAEVEQHMAGLSIAHRRLETSHAFHSTMLAPVADELTTLAGRITLHPPQIPYLSNVTGTWITAAEATDTGYWARHMSQTVRFADGVHALLQDPQRALIEVGPGWTLTSFVRQHPSLTAEQIVVPSLPHAHDRQPDLSVILATLGQLWLAGVSPDWQGFASHEQRRRIPLPTYPFERQRYWVQGSSAALSSRPVGETGKKPKVEDWLYLPLWKQTLPPQRWTQPSDQERACWLVFVDACGIASGLATRLDRAGHRVVLVHAGTAWQQHSASEYTLAPGARADYDKLFAALRAADLQPTRVVHSWSLTTIADEQPGVARFDALQEQGFISLLELAQALRRHLSSPVELTALANQLHAINSTDSLAPEKITLIGACKVIAQEYPSVICRTIDIELPSVSAGTKLLDQLTAELLTFPQDVVLAYRGHTRWVQTFEPIALPSVGEAHPRLRQGGVYLITGGLGNMGLALAEYLARAAQAKLVLVGRTGLPEREAWADWLTRHPADDVTSARIRRVQAIEAVGAEVLAIRADVASHADMRRAFDAAKERFGAVCGVIHAAGLTGEQGFSTIADTGAAERAGHFLPKVHGLYVLADLLRDDPPDFCLLCSSISATLGGLGLSSYAAANLFMDAFAQLQSQQSGRPWISVGWDGWRFAESADPGTGVGATLAGFSMTAAEGVDVFQRALALEDTPQVVVSTGDLQARIAQWVNLESLRAADTAQPRTRHARPATQQPYIAPRTPLEQQIAEIWQDVLGLEQVGIEDNFFELGGNSLIGLQVIARVSRAFQVELPLRQLFDAPTVLGLVASIENCKASGTGQNLPAIRALPRR